MSSLLLFSTNAATAKKLKTFISNSGRKLKLEINTPNYNIVEYLKEKEKHASVRKDASLLFGYSHL